MQKVNFNARHVISSLPTGTNNHIQQTGSQHKPGEDVCMSLSICLELAHYRIVYNLGRASSDVSRKPEQNSWQATSGWRNRAERWNSEPSQRELVERVTHFSILPSRFCSAKSTSSINWICIHHQPTRLLWPTKRNSPWMANRSSCWTASQQPVNWHLFSFPFAPPQPACLVLF